MSSPSLSNGQSNTHSKPKSSTPASTLPKPLSIAIIGGGIGGLAAAITLHNHCPHIQFTIYEAAHAFTETGAGINFGPNAARAMELISPALLARFAEARTSNEPQYGNLWMECRLAQDVPGQGSAEERFTVVEDHSRWQDFIRGGLRRSVFLDFCAELLPHGVAVFGKRLADIVPCGEGSGDVVLHFVDGTTETHTAVIGCDGIKSRTRQLVLGDDDLAAYPVFSGQYCYRGLIPMAAAVQIVGEKRARNGQVYHADGRYIVSYPVAQGQIMNFGAYKATSEPWTADEWILPGSKEEMLETFKDFGPGLKHVLQLVEKTDVWAIFNHLPARTFCNGRVCLLGDAAHASGPHQGAGAGIAVEDAYFLGMLLKDVHQGRDVVKAFEAYDRFRRPRGTKLVSSSLEAGEMLTLRRKETGADIQKIGEDWQKRMYWIWDYDIEDEVKKARELVQQTVGGQ